jgi:LacI family transcriptional regulator
LFKNGFMFIKSAKKRNEQQSTLVTMREVAELAGVSQSTVSRVLNQAEVPISISEETRRKVLEAVETLGYYPNMTARALRTQRTQMVAVMVADIGNSFYHSIARAIQDYFVEHNYDVLIANSDHRHENEQRFCRAMMRRPVDGIIMVPYHLKVEEIDQLIKRTGASITILGSHINHPLIDRVWCNDVKATYDAVRWLIDQKGYNDIAYIRVPMSYPTGQRRYDAYHAAMTDAGLTVHPEWVPEGDFAVAGGERAMRALLELPNRPQVVVACNDLMAIGALNVALEMNFRVPEDVGIVGFDDIPFASMTRPGLTTIQQLSTDMGRNLAEMLYERIEGIETGPARRREIPLHRIERQSA